MWTEFFYYAAAGLIVGGGIMLLAWALLWDRSRGRKRCPKCWYDMQGNEPGNLRCPECGKVIKTERRMFRTRRRWRWAALAVLVMLGGGLVGIQPKVQRDGWASVTPTSVLVLALWTNDPVWAMEGLGDRIWAPVDLNAPIARYPLPDRSMLFGWQWSMVARRFISILDEEHSVMVHRGAIDLLSIAEDCIDDEAVLDVIQDAYWRHALNPDRHVHGMATLSLGEDRNHQRGFDRLQSLYGHADPAVRRSAMSGFQIMLHSGNDLPLPLLVKALGDEQSDVRMLAAGVVSIYAQTPENYDAIAGMLKDPDGQVRNSVVYLLTRFEDQQQRTLDTIEQLVNSEDDALRGGALEALATMTERPTWAAESALKALDDSSPVVCESAIDLLHYLTIDELRPHESELERLLKHPDPDVVTAVSPRLAEFERAKDSE